MRPGESVCAYVYRAWCGGDERFQHRFEYPATAQALCQRPGCTVRISGGGYAGPYFPASRSLAHSRQRLGLGMCEDCRPERLVPHDGDVAMCTRCGQWWQRGGRGPARTGSAGAARAAREEMPQHEIIAALDRAAYEMEAG